jgi:hypothetical protein
MKKYWLKLIKFLATWSEIITIPLGIILWYFSDTFLRWLDPTAATYDAGIFQIILFSIIQFFIYSGVIWIYLKITFPDVYNYLDNALGKNLDIKNEKLTQWEKSKIVLWLFSLFLLTIVLLARIV